MLRTAPTIEGVTFGALRHLLGLTEIESAARTGKSRTTITNLERGATRKQLSNLLRELGVALGFRPTHIELLARCLALVWQGREAPHEPACGEEAAQIPWAVVSSELAAGRSVAAGGRESTKGAPRKTAAERERAVTLCLQLLTETAARQAALVEHDPAFRSWAVVEKLCEASFWAADTDSSTALRLAQLASRLATLCPPALRTTVEGYAGFFVANALRALSRLEEAEAASAEAWLLWLAPLARRRPPLPEWRPLDLTSSLRADQRRWKEAADFAEGSLAAAPPAARFRLIVQAGGLRLQAGSPERARTVLATGERWSRRKGDQRLVLGFHLTSARCLMELEHACEAERHLSSARRVAQRLGSALDLSRCLWLSGLLAAHQGSRDEALACLAQARRDFAHRQRPLDAAGAACDEVAIRLQAGETEEARAILRECAWVFEGDGIPRQDLAGLADFRAALESGSATARLALEARSRICGALLAGASRRSRGLSRDEKSSSRARGACADASPLSSKRPGP